MLIWYEIHFMLVFSIQTPSMKYHLNERNAMKRQKKMDFRCSGENHCSKLLFPYIDPSDRELQWPRASHWKTCCSNSNNLTVEVRSWRSFYDHCHHIVQKIEGAFKFFLERENNHYHSYLYTYILLWQNLFGKNVVKQNILRTMTKYIFL